MLICCQIRLLILLKKTFFALPAIVKHRIISQGYHYYFMTNLTYGAKTMKSRHLHLFIIAFLLLAMGNVSQGQMPENYPKAEEALNKIVQEKAFGKFQFDKKQIISIKNNDKVPGLNGLMFAYYKDKEGNRVEFSVQWFEDKKKLLEFYESNLEHMQRQMKGLKKIKINDNEVWGYNGKMYAWTDAEHIMLSMAGNTVPPEMVKAYLKAVPSKIDAIDKKEEKDQSGKDEEKETPEE